MKVTAIITNYNRYISVKDAIESVFLQTYKDIEIIVVDDCSEIKANEYLKAYIPRIKILQLDKNSGISHARNKGAMAASGDFIAFLDSDDLWLKDKITKQINCINKDKSLICHTDEFWYRKDRFVNSGKKHQKYGGFIFDKILDKCRVSPSSFIIEKNLFLSHQGFNENLKVCEDYELFIRLSVNNKFSYIPQKLIVKRAIESNSLSAAIKHIESLRLDILTKLACNMQNLPPEMTKALKEEIKKKESIVKNHIK